MAMSPDRNGEQRGPLRKVLPDTFGISEEQGQFIFETIRVTEANIKPLRIRVHPFETSLGYNVLEAPDEVRHNIQRGGEVLIAKYLGFMEKMLGRPPVDVGVLTHEVREGLIPQADRENRLVRADIVGVNVVFGDFQAGKKGVHISTKFAEDTLVRYRPDYFSGKTRNIDVIRKYQRLQEMGLIKRIFPIDEDYTGEVIDVLRAILYRAEFNRISNLRTGLCMGIYPEAALSSFVPRSDRAEALKVYDRFEEIGVYPRVEKDEKGKRDVKGKKVRNGVRYLAEVNQDALLAFIEERQKAQSGELLSELPNQSKISGIVVRAFGLNFLRRVAF